MARKNTQKIDSSSISFNTRTKVVMADVVQDNIKEKVTAVREVVRGKSNNEIVLVLQYYDYNVEKAIQAYLEDGAKVALTEWHLPGKQAAKKKKNRKAKQSNTPAVATPKSPHSVSSDTGSTASLRTNGDVNGEAPLVNGNVDFDTDTAHSQVLNNVDAKSSINWADSDPTEQPVLNGIHEGAPESGSQPLPQRERKSKSGSPADSAAQPHNQQSQGAKHPSHGGQRQRTHSGSHGHHGNRVRTISTASNVSISSNIDQKVSKKAGHLGLEKSVKDLHRQTVSLERLRFLFDEEEDRAYKRIKTVVEELRNCLKKKESELVNGMNRTKESAREIFSRRQSQAKELKVRYDNAERMNDTELATLRTDMKHFVSDRKIDEDLARTVRFVYDSDHLIEEINKFGEIVPIKGEYIPISRPEPHVETKVPHNPPSMKRTSPATESNIKSQPAKEGSKVPHVNAAEAHEMAELQRRLKHSLQLGGIEVGSKSNRPSSAPVSNNDASQTGAPSSGRPESANPSRNRNRNRGGQDRPERSQQENSGPTRPPYQQNQSGGERVVLIGRRANTQSSGSSGGAPRRGRGRGGYRGRGRGGFRDNDGPILEYTPTDLNPAATGQGDGAQTAKSPQRSEEKNKDAKSAINPRSPTRNPRRGAYSPRGQGRGQGRSQGQRSPGANKGGQSSVESKSSQPSSANAVPKAE